MNLGWCRLQVTSSFVVQRRKLRQRRVLSSKNAICFSLSSLGQIRLLIVICHLWATITKNNKIVLADKESVIIYFKSRGHNKNCNCMILCFVLFCLLLRSKHGRFSNESLNEKKIFENSVIAQIDSKHTFAFSETHRPAFHNIIQAHWTSKRFSVRFAPKQMHVVVQKFVKETDVQKNVN